MLKGFETIPKDVIIHCIVPHWNAQDLGRLMQVNRAYLDLFVSDTAWKHIYERCCKEVPIWREHLFNDTDVVKTAKTLLPNHGIWHTFCHFISPCLSLRTCKTFLKLNVSKDIQITIDKGGIRLHETDQSLKKIGVVLCGLCFLFPLKSKEEEWTQSHGQFFVGSMSSLTTLSTKDEECYDFVVCHANREYFCTRSSIYDYSDTLAKILWSPF